MRTWNIDLRGKELAYLQLSLWLRSGHGAYYCSVYLAVATCQQCFACDGVLGVLTPKTECNLDCSTHHSYIYIQYLPTK